MEPTVLEVTRPSLHGRGDDLKVPGSADPVGTMKGYGQSINGKGLEQFLRAKVLVSSSQLPLMPYGLHFWRVPSCLVAVTEAWK